MICFKLHNQKKRESGTTSSNISSSSTSFSSPRTVSTLALLALDILEPTVGELKNHGAPVPLAGEVGASFLDK